MQNNGYRPHPDDTTQQWKASNSEIPTYVEMNSNSNINGGTREGESFSNSRQHHEQQHQHQQSHRDNGVFRRPPPDIAASSANPPTHDYPYIAPASYHGAGYPGAMRQMPYYHDYGPPSSFESGGSGVTPVAGSSSAALAAHQTYGRPHHHAPPPSPYHHPHHPALLHASPHPGLHYSPPGVVGYYHPPIPPNSWPHPHHPGPPLPIVQDVAPSDVLCGRGGATNSHSGNRAFRALVKEHQKRYLLAKKRDKPSVASIVVELIRNKGGRFLRRYDTNHQGQVLWVDIGDERAREKTCQALRENAPEIRRSQKSKPGKSATTTSATPTSSEEEDHHHHDHHDKASSGTHYSSPKDTLSTSSSRSLSSTRRGTTRANLEQSPMPPPLPHYETSPRPHSEQPWTTAASLQQRQQQRDDNDAYDSHHERHDRQGNLFRRSSSDNTHRLQDRCNSTSDDDHFGLYKGASSSSYESNSNHNGNHNDDPITIRPMARLLPKHPLVSPIPLDQLSPQFRDLYLRDFLPPCPPITRKPISSDIIRATTLKKRSNTSTNRSTPHNRHHNNVKDKSTNDMMFQQSPPQPSSASPQIAPPQPQKPQQQQQEHHPWIVSV